MSNARKIVAAMGQAESRPDMPPSAPIARQIPKGHPFDPRALKPMAKALWATSVGLGHALTAYRYLNRLKSTTVSPDGLLGGRGYVMGMRDARLRLYDACEALSSIADTLYDEIQAPHWKPRLAMLDENDAQDVQRFVDESQERLDNPEEEAEEEIKEIESENDSDASSLPVGGPAEEALAKPAEPSLVKQASWKPWNRIATSSVPVDTLPGPRVDHIGPDGLHNPPQDEPSVGNKPRDYAYPSEWENDFRQAVEWAGSVLPDVDPTPSEAWDFGIGFGANGQGAGGYANPTENGKGVWGPHSGLPQASTLPGDDQPPVARSDYYRGWKDNLVQSESSLPSEPSTFVDTTPVPGFVTEDITTPYIRYDYTTPSLRQDPLHSRPGEE